jgi:hypothetical protein
VGWLAFAGFAAARHESWAALRSAQKSNRVAELLRELIATAEPASGKGQDFTVRAMLDAFSADLEQRHGARRQAPFRGLSGSGHRLPAVGQYYSINDRNNEAWSYFLKADPVLRRELPADHFRLLHIKVQLATCYRDAGDFPPAYQLLTEAVALTRRKAGEREADFHRAHVLRFLVGMYRVERRFTEARQTIAEWRQALAPHHAASHQLLLLADFHEALTFRDQAQLSGDAQLFEQAIAGFTRVLEGQSQALPEDHIDTLETRLELARTHYYAGHTNDAVRLVLHANQATLRKVSKDHQMTRKVLVVLEQIRRATGLPELDVVRPSEPAPPAR